MLFFVDFLFRVHTGFGLKTRAGFKRTRFTTQFLDAITPPSRQYSYIEYILTFKATARISRYHSRLNFKIPSQMPFQTLFRKKHQDLAQFNIINRSRIQIKQKKHQLLFYSIGCIQTSLKIAKFIYNIFGLHMYEVNYPPRLHQAKLRVKREVC